jgi:hypothetical protein
MKIIKLNESQFQRIFEGNGGGIIPSFNGGDLKEYPGSEISTTSHITNSNGEMEYGEQPTTDDFADQMSTQNYYANSLKGSRITNIF